ncbi:MULTISPECIES: YadA-like family protein [unclassified Lysobacter]|uniref:YadA family autotransporter adhesin n=1 Tax=unclassified Lysobacter TaxID=2635362 RepID=UPI001BE8103E|nr:MULTISPECIES: YadA-like family protein [unclassified Lysobacter]MBT2748908.1 YadA-like family protein [Lysobacter sp. ISL-42]MBT2753064.1 YadA-like family protein [Lysobacter sp. ISL-50]MBT2777233.1 YadA-like family protein [Lysobacter sp. ISL-54]MBT2783213.1 YadA-like family protein [Lysobacter sp. ISL-52]
MTRLDTNQRKHTSTSSTSARAKLLRASVLSWCIAIGMTALPATAAELAAGVSPDLESVESQPVADSGEESATSDQALDSEAPLLPLVFDGIPNRDTWSSASAFDGGMVSPMSVIEPPPALNNTLPGISAYLSNWLLGNDYQACGLLGSGCLTIDRANFNYSYLSLILNLVQAPNVLDLDGNQPANHLTLIGAVQSDSYIQFQDSNYTGNNNSASCVIIGLACTWQTNAAQNNQTIIGDGSYANGSNTIVMGTNARHQLPTITAAAAGFTGGPDTNYAARLGNSVVIGDNSFGNANRQTILGFGATSTHANSVALGAGSSTAVGAQAAYAAFGLIAPQTSSGEVSIGSAGATRKLTNVAAGSSGTDAVNLAQLQGALSTAASDPFSVKYDDLGGTPDFANVTLQGPGGTTVSNLRAGLIAAGSTQAVNGSQVSAISQSNAQHLGGGATVAVDGTIAAPNYVIEGNGYNNVGSALAAIDTGLANADAFAVQYNDDGAGNPDYGAITLRGPAGTGTLIGNLAAGQIAGGSLEAVNGGQIFAIGGATAAVFGGGAAFNTGGTFTAPNYVIGGTGYNNVGAALAALDSGQSTGNAFAVQYDDDGAGNPDYGNITLRGPAGTGTVLDNLAAGQIAAGSLQGVNGGQIFGLGTSIANLFGGGSVFNAGGTFTAPNYLIGGNTYNDVGSALTALDGNINGANAFAVQYDDDGAGNPDYGNITLRGPAGTGTVLGNLANGQIGAGSLEAVNGGQLHTMGSDLASIFGGGALFNSGVFGAPTFTVQGSGYQNVGAAFAAVDASLTNINNRIDNLPPATTSDPRIAIDGTGNASVAAGSRGVAVGASSSAGGDHATAIGGDSYAAGANDTAIGGNARVNADGSTAVGANTTIAAGATNAVAVGEGASVSAAGAVALGQGAVADRANTVSVGNAGQQRQVVNVAAGSQDNDAVNVAQLKASQNGTVRYDTNVNGSVNNTQITLNNGGAAVTIRNVRAGVSNTDAVNVQQLNEGVNRAITVSNTYTDNWGNSLRREIGQLDDKASAGVASAMAVAGLPQSYMPGKSMAAIAASSFRGETGFAIGVSTITEDGRYVYKLSGNSNSRGDVGVTVGAGIVW